jgi:5-methylthioadenosine/S-adenosylhomocysteine deaminase
MQRIRQGRTVYNARAALRWATQASADRLGLGNEIGSLSVGKRADILVMDTDAPTMAPLIDGWGVLVYGANGMNVRSVVVNGRLVIENGTLLTANGPAIVHEAQAVAETLWSRSGRHPITRPFDRPAR